MRLRLIINYTEVAAAKSGYWQCGTVLWRFDYPIQKSLSSTIYTKLDELTLVEILKSGAVGEEIETRQQPIKITYGYSRDRRPDLKQLALRYPLC